MKCEIDSGHTAQDHSVVRRRYAIYREFVQYSCLQVHTPAQTNKHVSGGVSSCTGFLNTYIETSISQHLIDCRLASHSNEIFRMII